MNLDGQDLDRMSNYIHQDIIALPSFLPPDYIYFSDHDTQIVPV